MNFDNSITEIHSIAQALPMKCSSGSARMRFTNCGNQVAENGTKKKKRIVVVEIWGGIKKKCATSTIFLQHFHNKSQVISCY